MSNINFTTSKGTKYILSFDQLDNPENIEVSFKTKDQGYEATNKGEVFEVMQIITGKIKQFLEKFKEKYPKKLNDFELYIDPISEENEGDLGFTEKNKRTQLYLRYISKNLNPEEYRVEVIDNLIAIYYNTGKDISYYITITGTSSGKPVKYTVGYKKGSEYIFKNNFYINVSPNEPLNKDIINYIKNYKSEDVESLKQELTDKGLKISNTFI
jgi:hypothetical protein